MAKTFTPKDAKRLTDRYKGIRADLAGIAPLSSRYQDEIKDAVRSLVRRVVREQLKDVPIEEINREKRGFRVQLLREQGYRTLADISGASVARIAAIHGIGEDTAQAIHSVVKALVREVRRSVKIRLSLDDKSEGATKLVVAVSKYRQIQPLIKTSRQLTTFYDKKIVAALDVLQPATGRIGWILTSGKNKQKAKDAYQYLTELLSTDRIKKAEHLRQEVNRVDRIQGEEAWADFAADPIGFFAILEKIAPGVLGADDAEYGLPEELAKEIRDEPIYLDGALCQLRRYQEWGVRYILHQKRVLLGDEMGLGKTVQAIVAMVSLKNTGATHFMVVCPASVISNWCREIERHSCLTAIKIHGADRADALRVWKQDGGVAVTNYETTGTIELEDHFSFALLVVDEAHYIKNPEAQRTVNVNAIAGHADRLLFMTGTALENDVDEMIALIRMLQPNIAEEIQRMAFLAAAPQFREKIAPVYYRRKREDVLTELPDLIESQEWCTLTEEEEAVYEEAVLAKRYAEARRVSWSIEDLHRSSKARRLLELIEEAEGDGRKIIVFSFFLDTIRKICALLGDRCTDPINGSVSPERRQEIIDGFETAPVGTVLPAQIQAGGTGLNIQAASVVILCEPQFKPSTEVQAISRAYRMGQTRNVLVYRLLCEDTVDEKIVSLLAGKQKIFDAFADESAAAAAGVKLELDEQSFGNIIQEEIDRIQAKRGDEPTEPTS